MKKVYGGEEVRLKSGEKIVLRAGAVLNTEKAQLIVRVPNDGSTRQQRRAAARGQA